MISWVLLNEWTYGEGKKEKKYISLLHFMSLWNLSLMFTQKYDLACDRCIVTAHTHTLCTNLSNQQEKKRESTRMITSCPIDLGQRVIYERREREKTIHIVPSVSIQSCSRSSNLLEVTICFCTCYYNDINNNNNRSKKF